MLDRQKPFTLYKRPKSENFYIRFYKDGKEIRQSLGTSNELEANRKAYEIFGVASARKLMGLNYSDPTVNELIPKYFEYLDSKVQLSKMTNVRANQHKRIVEFYLSKFCGDKNVSYLSTSTIEQFFDWRRTFWITGPGTNIAYESVVRCGRKIRRKINQKTKRIPAASTIQMEQSGIYLFLRWLSDNKIILDNISIKYDDTEHNARPAFTKDELHKFNQHITEKAMNCELTEYRTKYKLRMFLSFCGFMLATGIRPTEARGIKWKHIIGFNMKKYELDDFIKVSIQVSGKGKYRSVVPLPEVIIALDGLLAAHLDYFNEYPNDDDLIFCNTLKKKPEDLDKMMNDALIETGLERDYRGNKRTTYSFRHTYITFQLISGINVYFLAKNTGTSVDMIKKHYDHSTVEQHRMSLIPDAYKKAMGLLMVNDSVAENETKPHDKQTDIN